MSHLLNYNRGFGPNFLQSLLGQNTSTAALNAQQYMDTYNYYKNLGTAFADMNPYGSLPGLTAATGPGRMPASSTASTVATNPLAALGDLSMFGLSTTALQSLGANSAALNLPSSLANSNSAALQQLSTTASMYTSPSALNTNLPITSASNMAAGSVASASNSAAVLSAYEQYKQSLRGSFNNMYNYTGDFGLSSSGSTILDSSKSKNSKQMSSNNKNLPGGSKTNSAMNAYSTAANYMAQNQTQSQTQQQQQRPSSRNTPTYEPQQQQQQKSNKSNTTSNKPTSLSSSPSTATSTLMNPSDINTTPRSSSLLNYRRSDSTSTTQSNTPKLAADNSPKIKNNSALQQKKSKDEGANNINSANNKAVLNTSTAKVMKTPTTGSQMSNQKSNQKSLTISTSNNNNADNTNKSSSTSNTGSTNSSSSKSSSSSNSSSTSKSSNSTSSNSSSATKLSSKSSTSSATSDANRAMNMGILYPNSKNLDKALNKPNSPVNMGIVYPKSSNKSSSEMQIIPTTSPPGTISISKQLNELSPSISLTALKNNTGNKTPINQNMKTNNNSNAQINKIIQNNSNIRKPNSPVNTNANKTSTSNLNTSNSPAGSSAASNTTTNQSNLLARIKMANSQKSVNNNPVPPLHRAATIASISTANTSNKSGLTITNVKNPIKTPNKAMTSSQQISTLAKQTAAAAVAKSTANRLNTPTAGDNNTTLQKNLNSPNNTPLPSLTSIKRIVKRNSPTVNVAGNTAGKLPALTSSPSLTVTSSNKLPIISSVKSISQYPTTMATISKASITKINSPSNQASNNSVMLTKTSTTSSSSVGSNQPSVSNVSKTLAQMQKRLPISQSATTSSAGSTNAIKSTVNIRPVDTKQNPSGTGSGYIIETNINDKKLAIGAPTKR